MLQSGQSTRKEEEEAEASETGPKEGEKSLSQGDAGRLARLGSFLAGALSLPVSERILILVARMLKPMPGLQYRNGGPQ